jgi:hypothetical protein
MNDDQLRDAFAELRRVEQSRVPAFSMERPRRRRYALQLAFAALVLIIAAVFMLPRRPPAPSISVWRAPTDFLLQTPGRELLTSTPDLKGTTQ